MVGIPTYAVESYTKNNNNQDFDGTICFVDFPASSHVDAYYLDTREMHFVRGWLPGLLPWLRAAQPNLARPLFRKIDDSTIRETYVTGSWHRGGPLSPFSLSCSHFYN